MAEAAFNDIAALVAVGVEIRGPAPAVSAVDPVSGLIAGLCDRGGDRSVSQVGADGSG